MNATANISRLTHREWIRLAVITLRCLLCSMDRTVLNLALPKLGLELRPGSLQILWFVYIFSFMIAALMITMGAIGERIGRRRLLVTITGSFSATMILAALVMNSEMLIAARILLRIAGAAQAPATLYLIHHVFTDARKRTLAVIVWMAALFIGGAMGPMLGDILMQQVWADSVILVAAPLAVLLLLVPVSPLRTQNCDSEVLPAFARSTGIETILTRSPISLNYGPQPFNFEYENQPLRTNLPAAMSGIVNSRRISC